MPLLIVSKVFRIDMHAIDGGYDVFRPGSSVGGICAADFKHYCKAHAWSNRGLSTVPEVYHSGVTRMLVRMCSG